MKESGNEEECYDTFIQKKISFFSLVIPSIFLSPFLNNKYLSTHRGRTQILKNSDKPRAFDCLIEKQCHRNVFSSRNFSRGELACNVMFTIL